MLIVDKNTHEITLTRGDTGIFNIDLKDGEGEDYTPQEGDKLEFAMAKNYDSEVIIYKIIPMDTLILRLDHEDTKDLEIGKYVYEVQFTSSQGDVSTIILSTIKITKDVI